MATLVEQLKQVADVVLVDSPPVLVVADGSILASQAEGTIVVVDGFKTRSSSLRAALDTLKNTQVDVLGVIINKLKRVRFGYGYAYPYYYDYYYYSYYSSGEANQPHVNGTGPFYKRPIGWVKSALSKFPAPRNRH